MQVHRVHLLFTVVFTDLVVEGFLNSLYDLLVKVKKRKQGTVLLETVSRVKLSCSLEAYRRNVHARECAKSFRTKQPWKGMC